MRFILLFFIMTNFALAATSEVEKNLLLIRESFEKKMDQLKLEEETTLAKAKGIKDFSLSTKSFSCIDWIYRGLISRTEAVEACRGVTNISCLDWAYHGLTSRIEAAEMCRGRVNMTCVQWVYHGLTTRAEALEACQGVTDMKCVEFLYRGLTSRVEAARSCQNSDGYGRPHDRPECE
ncbi:MAG: hypothetical protein U0T83_01135 [Bacteriovoracaceae bacterium]